jgi:hypothetical protein
MQKWTYTTAVAEDWYAVPSGQCAISQWHISSTLPAVKIRCDLPVFDVIADAEEREHSIESRTVEAPRQSAALRWLQRHRAPARRAEARSLISSRRNADQRESSCV